MVRIAGHTVVSGVTEGLVLRSEQPLSFWGGIDAKTGRIIDARHDRHGQSIAGRIFVFPFEKGSSTASAVLVELVRIGRAPAAIITTALCPILALGSLVAEQLYGRGVPIVVLEAEAWHGLREAASVRLEDDGSLILDSPGPSG